MDLFKKRNSSPFSDQLLCEAKGLESLRALDTPLSAPSPIKVSETLLVTEKIDARPFDDQGWKKLGEGLAVLHRHRGESFGLDYDNYIGLNPQINSPSQDWGEFFLKNRLGIQIEFMADSQMQERLLRELDLAAPKLRELLNSHGPGPAPLHGDLWAGNVLYDGENPWLIDPAFYWGDREADIAMSEMFGTFGEEFYKAYNASYEMDAGYSKRKVVYNLYHYLNHYNLFGSSYLGAVNEGFEFIKGI